MSNLKEKTFAKLFMALKVFPAAIFLAAQPPHQLTHPISDSFFIGFDCENQP
jgi:hypothetical protein